MITFVLRHSESLLHELLADTLTNLLFYKLWDIPVGHSSLCKSTFFPLLQTLFFEIVPLRVTVYIIEEWTSSWLQRSISQMLILTSLLWVSVSGMGQADMRLLGLLFHQITALILIMWLLILGWMKGSGGSPTMKATWTFMNVVIWQKTISSDYPIIDVSRV